VTQRTAPAADCVLHGREVARPIGLLNQIWVDRSLSAIARA
jgi:hypothetical protein